MKSTDLLSKVPVDFVVCLFRRSVQWVLNLLRLVYMSRFPCTRKGGDAISEQTVYRCLRVSTHGKPARTKRDTHALIQSVQHADLNHSERVTSHTSVGVVLTKAVEWIIQTLFASVQMYFMIFVEPSENPAPSE